MPIPSNTLEVIRRKVRLLTNSPGPQQATDQEITDYINTFVLYDFPEHIRISSLLESFSFTAQPHQETYQTGIEQASTNQLYNFNNIYTTVLDPVYVDGYSAYLSQSPGEYNRWTSNIKQIQTLGQGNGSIGPYSFTLPNTPVLPGSTVITTLNALGFAMSLEDREALPLAGIFYENGNEDLAPRGGIEYQTGELEDIEFPAVVPVGNNIQAHFVPYRAGRPTMILWYGNEFKLRPVPDKAYTIEMQVYKRPDLILETPESAQHPLLKQWWQYIAYGAAKKVLEDRGEPEMVALLMPEYEKQEDLVLRKSLVQDSIKRSSTIYANQVELNMFNNYNGNFWF